MPIVIASAETNLTELIIVLALILLNGIFALSELAIVSARRQRLKAMAAAKRPGASQALTLAADPGKFLSAFQMVLPSSESSTAPIRARPLACMPSTT